MKINKYFLLLPILPISILPTALTSCNKEEKPVTTIVNITGERTIEFNIKFNKYTFDSTKMGFDFFGGGDYALRIDYDSHTFDDQTNELTIYAEYYNGGEYIAFTGELSIHITISTADDKILSFQNTCIFSWTRDYKTMGEPYPLKIITKEYQGYTGNMVLRKFEEVQE